MSVDRSWRRPPVRTNPCQSKPIPAAPNPGAKLSQGLAWAQPGASGTGATSHQQAPRLVVSYPFAPPRNPFRRRFSAAGPRTVPVRSGHETARAAKAYPNPLGAGNVLRTGTVRGPPSDSSAPGLGSWSAFFASRAWFFDYLAALVTLERQPLALGARPLTTGRGPSTMGHGPLAFGPRPCGREELVT